MATGSRDEYIKALEAEAEARRKQDVINTNILNSDDPNLLIAQDIIIGMAVGQVVDALTVDLLKDSLLRALKGEKAVKIPFKNSRNFLKLGPGAVRKCLESTTSRIKSAGLRAVKVLNQAPKAFKAAVASAKASRIAIQNAIKKMSEKKSATAAKLSGKASRKIADAVARMVGRAAAKASAAVAKQTAAMSAKATAMAAACAGGPIVCAASIAITVVLLAFDVVNIVLDIMDTKGYSVVIYKADIKAIAESTKEWMNIEYNTQEDPAFFDEEIFFDWESFLYDIDENDNIVANEEWVPRYEAYRDEYMKIHFGITGDWRSRIETVDASKPDDPGVLAPITLQMQELSKTLKKQPKKPKRNTNTNTVLIVSILTVVFVVGIIIFMNSNGEYGSEPSTNNGGT
jgi:hypothetical protein